MNITLRDRIKQFRDLHPKDSNDTRWIKAQLTEVVYCSAALAGSNLTRKDNSQVMWRNNPEGKWLRDKKLRDGKRIQFPLKNAHRLVDQYIEKGYDITPGRLRKLHDTLTGGQDNEIFSDDRFREDVNLNEFLLNLNRFRDSIEEFSDPEIYDLSFEMQYKCWNVLTPITGRGRLSRLVMYWIQRENNLLPIPINCKYEDYEEMMLAETSEDFRIFMRKQLIQSMKDILSGKSPEKRNRMTSRDRILDLIKRNPRHTAKTMAAALGLSRQAVQKQIAILKMEGRLERVGPDKGGFWRCCANTYVTNFIT